MSISNIKWPVYFIYLFCLVCFSCQTSTRNETIHLFNGSDLVGWHIDVPDMDKDSTWQSPFLIRDGMLVSMGTPNGHIITDAEYENFKLEVEYRFAGEPGNCGVLVFASTPRALYEMFPKSIEVQMMHENAGDFWCIVEDITVPGRRKSGESQKEKVEELLTSQMALKTRWASGILWSLSASVIPSRYG